MGTLTPSQMYDHSLNVIKGPSKMHRLDYHAASKSGETIYAGAVCAIDANGQLIAGVPTGTTFNRPMPMFAIQSVNDFDANSDVGNTSGGVMSAVVATGGYEIETTEFVTGTYNENDLLTAASGASAGKVKRMTISPYGSQNVVGCISTGSSTNADGKSVLRFWSMFLPAKAEHQASSSSSLSSPSSSTQSITSSSDSSLSSNHPA